MSFVNHSINLLWNPGSLSFREPPWVACITWRIRVFYHVVSHIFHKIFRGSIDFQNMTKSQLKIEIRIRNLTTTGKGQQILLVFTHLNVAEFSKSLPVNKIMLISTIISFFSWFLLNYTSTCVMFKGKRKKLIFQISALVLVQV